jgi:hypothetical protein
MDGGIEMLKLDETFEIGRHQSVKAQGARRKAQVKAQGPRDNVGGAKTSHT